MGGALPPLQRGGMARARRTSTAKATTKKPASRPAPKKRAAKKRATTKRPAKKRTVKKAAGKRAPARKRVTKKAPAKRPRKAAAGAKTGDTAPQPKKETHAEAVIEALRKWGVVTVACHAAGVSRKSFYRWKQEDEDFAKAAADALEESTELMEAEAQRRAMLGVRKPVFYQGKRCGDITEYSDTLLIFLLKARRPDKYRERFAATVENPGEIARAIHEALQAIDSSTDPKAEAA